MTLFSGLRNLSKAVLAIVACMPVYSCGEHADKTASAATVAPPSAGMKKEVKQDAAIEVMGEADIRLNGKLERYFTIQQFASVLGQPDSARLLSDEEPCTAIFEEADGTVDAEAKYLYKNGSRYESAKGKVAISEISFSHGDFIVFHGSVLNKHTTLNDLEKIFPNAVKHIRVTEVAGEGKMEVMELREDEDNVSDGHINLFIKDGKLFSLHWWFPC